MNHACTRARVSRQISSKEAGRFTLFSGVNDVARGVMDLTRSRVLADHKDLAIGTNQRRMA